MGQPSSTVQSPGCPLGREEAPRTPYVKDGHLHTTESPGHWPQGEYGISKFARLLIKIHNTFPTPKSECPDVETVQKTPKTFKIVKKSPTNVQVLKTKKKTKNAPRFTWGKVQRLF